MPTIAKRKYWVNPETGKMVRKGTPGAELRESKIYTIVYADASGKSRRKRGYTDRRATEQLAARTMKDLALGLEGLTDTFAAPKQRPLIDHFVIIHGDKEKRAAKGDKGAVDKSHLADYLAFQADRKRDDKYRYNLEKRIRKALGELGWRYFGDIDAAKFETWMSAYMKREKVSGATANQFLDSMRAFINWGCDNKRKRFPSNPLSTVDDMPHTPTFQRMSLTAGQVEALLNTCVDAGRNRVYKFAVATGLRRQELEDLEWGDIVLDTPTPFLKLRVIATKGRRADQLPMRADVAAEMLAFRPVEWKPKMKVFFSVPSVEEFREDLRGAGVVTPVDDFDRLDFHGLRTTLGSLLAEQGTAPRMAMELMRHTDMRLTQKIYTDPRIFDLAKEVEKLRLPTHPTAQSETMKATGTDGNCAENWPVNIHRDTPPAAASRRDGVECKNEETPTESGFTPLAAATRRQSPDTSKTPRVGFEPTEISHQNSENIAFSPQLRSNLAGKNTAAGSGERRREAAECETGWDSNNLRNGRGNGAEGGVDAQADALDPRLLQLMRIWNVLPETVRAQILELTQPIKKEAQ